MKKKTLQKVFTVALVGAMAMSTLAGCGDDAGGSSTTGGSTEQQPADTGSSDDGGSIDDGGSTAVAGMEGWQPFAENVTLQVPVYDRGQEGVPTVDSNYWTQWVQENFGDKYNITVEYVGIPRQNVMDTYALLASDQSLPTILMEYDFDKTAKWADDGYLAELDVEQFKQIAPTYYSVMEEEGLTSYVALNGVDYFALAKRPYYNTGYDYVNFVRMDWLKEVGYDHIPATRAEYLDAMQKIMEAGLAEHPGGGQLTTNGVDQNNGYRTYPLDEEEWAIYGDYNIPSLGWEPNRKLLKALNEEYNLGITNPEYYVTTAEEAKSLFVQGKTYKFGGYIAATMDWLENFYKENPDAELAVELQSLEPDTEFGTVPGARANNPFGMMIGFSSQATDDEILAAMMYMEWMIQDDILFQMQWGVEGQTFNYDENGLPVSVPYTEQPVEYKQGYNNSKDYWCIAVEAANTGTVEDDIAMASPVGLPVDFTADLIQNYYNKVQVAEKGWVVSDCLFGGTVQGASDHSADLQARYIEYRDKLVMCAPEEFDALYDQYAQEYWEAGYEDVVNDRRALYEAGMTTHLPK